MNRLILAAALAAAFAFAACRKKVPKYSLDIPYGDGGYFVLHAGDETYGLRRNDMYVSTAAAPGSWMAFWGDDPPAFTRPSAVRVLKDPFLARVRGGRWQVTSAPHQLDLASGAATLREIRSGEDGEPRLVYAGGEERPVTGWTDVESVRFLSLPRPADR